MKNVLYYVLLVMSCKLHAQVSYSRFNIELLSLITPNFGVPSVDNRFYSGCWGWYQAAKNKEYAICGASNGTYFIDVSAPSSPSVCAYVAGRFACTWREMKTYQHYCYIVSDDAVPNRFQIVDLQYLPDSVHVVYDGGQEYFQREHTVFIDQDKMYVGSVTTSTGYSGMNVYSLATPTAPLLLRQLMDDVPTTVIPGVHDMYVRNDTVYASCGNSGLYVLKFNTPANTFSLLGSYTGYTEAGYNHSSWLTRDGKQLVFCDEVPDRLPIHVVDVQNLNNIQPLQTLRPYRNTTPHNPYVIGNDFAVVSCYQDGLFIYDISQPGNAVVSGFFDTHPQGGESVGDYFAAPYRGNWGAYPYLPSGIIIAQDMQNGIFILDPTKAYANRVGVDAQGTDRGLSFFPNPADAEIHVTGTTGNYRVLISDLLGRTVYEAGDLSGNQTIDTRQLANGTYLLTVSNRTFSRTEKLIIHH